MQKIAVINPLTHPFFAATATKEGRVAAIVAGVTAITAGASGEAEASTTSDIKGNQRYSHLLLW
jgi:hypothetical protein